MSESSQYWKKPPDQHTKIKSAIVTKYFSAWSKIIGQSTSQLTYLDVYAGRGEHESGELSTALQVVEMASNDKFLCRNLNIILNDKVRAYTDNIKEVLLRNGYFDKFKKEIEIKNFEVNEFTPELLDKIKSGSTFCFIDPHGFKGVTIALIGSAIRDWGCDCLVFFHTNGINRNIKNEKCVQHLRLLYGDKHYDNALRRINIGNEKREIAVLDEFKIACNEVGVNYFLPFQMNQKLSERISHHLVFLSKHRRGFAIMKDVMSEYSIKEDSIPLYKYVEGRDIRNDQLSLEIGGPMDNLKRKLLIDFKNKRIEVGSIVEMCHKNGMPITTKNVKNALMLLESEGKVRDVTQRARKRRKGTLGDSRIICFI